MTIDVLICTIDHGISSVPGVLLQPAEGVRYIVSMQYTDEKYLNEIPESLQAREDVRVVTLAGRGLTLNRNHALDASTADIVLIADDDERLLPDAFDKIREAYENQPEADIALFQLNNIEDRPFKTYPETDEPLSYADACEEGYYPSSLEITIRGKAVGQGLRFNEHFGIGSLFPCGEEDILLCDASRKGLQTMFFPEVIAQTIAGSTGTKFLTNVGVQRAKGAVFRYCHGKWNALWRILKETVFYLVHKGQNPFPLFYHMYKGIRQVKRIM
ncbi:MAG: glycosyltransferase [Bacteroidaceae bacterium]|nr:glycosyltransferase [Bacteroidaceae bacterium]